MRRKFYKINPYRHEKIQIMLNYKTIDGDQSLLNTFAVRKRITIGDLIDGYKRLTSIDADIERWEMREKLLEIDEYLRGLNEKQRAELLDGSNLCWKGDDDDLYRISEPQREAWKRASGRLTGLIPHGTDGETLSEYIARKRREEKGRG
jgi:hypothetical protein